MTVNLAPEVDTDLIKAARAAVQQDREQADALAMLVKHPAWPVYEALLDGLLAKRGALLMEPLPPNELNAVERAEHNKGTMYGIAFVRDLPRVILAAADEARKSEPASEDDDDEA